MYSDNRALHPADQAQSSEERDPTARRRSGRRPVDGHSRSREHEIYSDSSTPKDVPQLLSTTYASEDEERELLLLWYYACDNNGREV